MWDKSESKRAMAEFPVRLIHESFAAEYAARPATLDVRALSQGDFEQLPPTYHNHPVTRAKGKYSSPLGYFSDAIPHTKKDSFFVFFWTSLVEGPAATRHLTCTLRMSDLCQCGCRGQCTFRAVSKIIVWSFNALASGKWPDKRHDGIPLDEARARREGPLAEGLAGALVEMRADLLEFTGALGFKNWDDKLHPCFVCAATLADMYNWPTSIETLVWALKDMAKYMAEVQAATVAIRVDAAQLALLKTKLTTDHPRGMTGLGLAEDLPALGLQRGSVLVVDGSLADLRDIWALEAPADLLFFRNHDNHSLNFLCVLFDIVGFTPQCLALDVMHVFDLGVVQWLVATVFHVLIEGDAFESGRMYAVGKRLQGMIGLNKRIQAYYRSMGPRQRGRASRIGRLTSKMLGPSSAPALRAKAAESRHLLDLAAQLTVEHNSLFNHGPMKFLPRACVELQGFYKVMSASPRRLSPEALRRMRQHITMFLVCWGKSGGHFYPKHHMAWHIAQRADELGNPRFYHTYADEGENRAMAKVAKAVHGSRDSFYKSVLQRVIPEAA